VPVGPKAENILVEVFFRGAVPNNKASVNEMNSGTMQRGYGRDRPELLECNPVAFRVCQCDDGFRGFVRSCEGDSIFDQKLFHGQEVVC
jgi:hypothetical protein